MEGIGGTIPTRSQVRLSRADIRFLRDAAQKRTRYRSYRHRADAWGRGFVPDPVLVGLGGEHALCVYLNRCGYNLFADLALRPDGDGGKDVVVLGLVAQVKTRTTNYGETLVRRVDDLKRVRALECDFIVSAQWDGRASDVSLLGWLWSASARECGRLKKSPRYNSTHWNLVVDDTALLPMSDLKAELASRSAAL